MGRIKFVRRIKFAKHAQKKFLDLGILKLNSPSLRGLLQFGFSIKYSTLKNYYNGTRLISEDFFDDLCEIALIDKSKLKYKYICGNWGQVKGGKKSKKKKNDPTKNRTWASSKSTIRPNH
ncbi:MAG: hypothetical protein IH845_04860 [Nanoarchaeota archaeon]|nr:hypothetical protein [Nanoarchaeota archaeon]